MRLIGGEHFLLHTSPSGGTQLGRQDSGAWLSAELLERILGSARRAGPHLIVSRGDCTPALDALTEAGFVREQRGHIVLTAKGRERRRSCEVRPAA